jgi:hypothetical protein
MWLCRWRCLLGLFLLGLVTGCSKKPEPVGTGAKEAALTYFEALLRQDWPAAYAQLHADSRSHWHADRFTQAARDYLRQVGFEPATVHVRACDEREAEATAHVILTGRSGMQERRYRDAIVLRREEMGWHVVLPANFGKS